MPSKWAYLRWLLVALLVGGVMAALACGALLMLADDRDRFASVGQPLETYVQKRGQPNLTNRRAGFEIDTWLSEAGHTETVVAKNGRIIEIR